jgi:hypothetical protein
MNREDAKTGRGREETSSRSASRLPAFAVDSMWQELALPANLTSESGMGPEANTTDFGRLLPLRDQAESDQSSVGKELE